MEEAETLRFIEMNKKKKKEEAEEKRRMLEILARDKEERFGIKFDPLTLQAKTEKPAIERIDGYFKSIHSLYPTFRNGDKAQLCFKTIGTAVNNILTKDDEKFRKIKMTIPAVQERIGSIPMAMKSLEAMGFKEEGEFLVVNDVDKELFDAVYKLTLDYLKKYE